MEQQLHKGKPFDPVLQRVDQERIIFIQDLVDDNGQIMNKQKLEHKLQFQIKPLRYESLISAIPNEWKRILKHNQNLNSNYLVFRDPGIIINNMKRRITELKAR
jgi:hypothetical protein